jgi:F-type H+-transporting ATPase subunit delta
MHGEILGRRYAKALFDLTKDAPDRSSIASLLTELGRQLDERSVVADACLNPRYPAPAKRALLIEVARRAGAGDIAAKFLGLLLKKNRLSFLSAIASAYESLLDEEAGRRRVTVTSARVLDQQEQGVLKRKLESVTARTISMELAVDPGILGGLVIRSGSVSYDASLKGQLERLRRQLVAT